MTPSFQMLILLVSGSARPSIYKYGHSWAIHEMAPGFAGLASPLIRAAGEASDVDSASQVRSARGNQGCTSIVIPLLLTAGTFAASSTIRTGRPASSHRSAASNRRWPGCECRKLEVCGRVRLDAKQQQSILRRDSDRVPLRAHGVALLSGTHAPLDGRPRRVPALGKIAGHRWDTRGEA